MSRSRPANVYVIGGEEGPQKIGVSDNLEARLVNLQVRRPVKLRLITHVHRPSGDARLVERFAHHLLREKHASGEWFNVSVQEAVDAVAEAIRLVDEGQHDTPPWLKPTGNPLEPVTRKSITLPPELWQEVADFRFAERIDSQAEAVRRLVEEALKARKAPR